MRLPIAIETDHSGAQVVFLDVGSTLFADPFFLDTLDRRFGIPCALDDCTNLVHRLHYDQNDPRLTREPLDIFVGRRSSAMHQVPSLIFHITRCGSTLVAQMLIASGRFSVLSEPPILNAILDPRGSVAPDYKEEVLNAALIALMEGVPPEFIPVIKLRSWNALYAESIARAAPRVRWLFIHRLGVEVLASVLQSSPGWLRVRSSYATEFAVFLGLSVGELGELSDAEYAGRFIGAIFQSASTLPALAGMVVDYGNILEAVRAIALHFGCALSSEELRRARMRAQYYSKNGTRRFESDSRKKREDASAKQHLVARLFIEPWRASINDRALIRF